MSWLRDPAPPAFISAALLFLRLIVGAAFVLHGRPKLAHPTSWMGAPGTGAPPAALQVLAVVAEVGGGLAVLLGLLTRLGAAGILAMMIGALVTVHLPNRHPFVSTSAPSSELPFVYIAIALVLLVVGPGAWSLDALLLTR